MTGPDHSKKPKNVTIDLSKDDVRAADGNATTVTEAVAKPAEPAKPATSTETVSGKPVTATAKPAAAAAAPAAAPRNGGGFAGKAIAGLAGGIVALAGAAGLQATGQLPSFGSGTEVAALRQQVNDLAAKPVFDPAPIQSALESANSEIASLKEQIAKVAPGTGDAAALQSLADRVGVLESQAASPSADGGGDTATAAMVQALSAKVTALENVQQSPNGASAVALAIAASGLKAAIDRGGPFKGEMETYASVAAASPDVDALRTLASSGVPSQADLVLGFNAAANAMIAAASVPDANASILQRLTDSAASLVKTRRVGDVAGDEPDAVVARMEVALNKGDLEAVLGESAKLPDASRMAGKSWLDQVAARRDANSLVTRALGQALTAAGGKS